METPCVNICRINPRTGYCEGCNRTEYEINNWTKFSADERAQVMEELLKDDRA